MQPSLERRLLAGGVWALVGKFATAASGVAVDALLVRLLGSAAFGVYGLAFSVVTVAAMAAQLGLHQAIVRVVAESMGREQPGRARAGVRFVFRGGLLGVAAVGALLCVLGDRWLARGVWDSPLLGGAMVGLAVWTGLRSLEVLTSETFRGFQDLRYATLFGGAVSGVLSVALLAGAYLWRGEATLGHAIGAQAVATAVSLGIGLLVLYGRVVPRVAVEPLAAREVLSIALPMWVSGVTAFLLTRLDVWILGAYLAKSELGVYFGASRLVALVGVTLILVNLVVPPTIAQLWARGERERLERVLRTTATLAGLPAFGVLAAFALFGAPILGWIYTPEYRAGALVLAILAVGKLVNVWTGSCGVTLGMTGHHVHLMRITLVTSAVTVGASLLAVRPFGMLGVAVAVSAGTAAQNVAMWLVTKRLTGMWTHAAWPRRSDVRALLERLRPPRSGAARG